MRGRGGREKSRLGINEKDTYVEPEAMCDVNALVLIARQVARRPSSSSFVRARGQGRRGWGTSRGREGIEETTMEERGRRRR